MRGDHHKLEGILLDGKSPLHPILRLEDGGEWRLDVNRPFKSMLRHRVRVEGIRSEFDLIDVTFIEITSSVSDERHTPLIARLKSMTKSLFTPRAVRETDEHGGMSGW